MVIIDMKKDDVKQQIREELARRSYLDYCMLTNGRGWSVGKHIKYMSEQLEDFLQSNERIMTISMPPQ